MENGDKLKFTEDIAGLKVDMDWIKTQVSNHIPTSIKDLSERNNEEHEKLSKCLSNIDKKFWWVITLLIATLVSMLVQSIL